MNNKKKVARGPGTDIEAARNAPNSAPIAAPVQRQINTQLNAMKRFRWDDAITLATISALLYASYSANMAVYVHSLYWMMYDTVGLKILSGICSVIFCLSFVDLESSTFPSNLTHKPKGYPFAYRNRVGN
jgi:hypothetical protein